MALAESETRLREVKRMLRSLLLPNKHGLLVTDLTPEYWGMMGKGIPWRALGFSSLLALLKAMPDTCSLVELPGGELLVRARPDTSTQHIAAMVAEQKENREGYNQHTGRVVARYSTALKPLCQAAVPSFQPTQRIPDAVRERLAQLVSHSPAGLLHTEMPRKYRDMFGEELELWGASSALELVVSQLGEKVRLQHCHTEVLVYPAAATALQDSAGKRQNGKEDTGDSSSAGRPGPGPGRGAILEVRITAVRPSGKVFLHIRDQHHLLMELEAGLGARQEEAVSWQQVYRGGHYVARIGEKWVRVSVRELSEDEDWALLFLWDYGLLEQVRQTEVDLCRLSGQEEETARLAVPARLEGLTALAGRAGLRLVCRELRELALQQADGWQLVATVVTLAQHGLPEMVVKLENGEGKCINQELLQLAASGPDGGNQISPKVISLSEKIHTMMKRSKNAVLAAKSENDLCQLEFLLIQLDYQLLKLEDINVQHPHSSISPTQYSDNDNIVEVRDSGNEIRTLGLSGIKRMGESKATDIEVVHIRAIKTTGGSLNLFSSEDKIWCASSDVSCLVCGLQRPGLLKSLLEKKGIVIPLSNKDIPPESETWKILVETKCIPAIRESTTVPFMLLADVPSVLLTFNKVELSSEVKQFIDNLT